MDKTVKVVLSVVVIAGICLMGYHWIGRRQDNAVQSAREQEKEACLRKIAEMTAEIDKLMAALNSSRQPLPSQADLHTVFGEEKPVSSMQPDSVDCARVTAQTAAFFQYLDSKAYFAWPGINMRAEELFEEIVGKLAANPPINVGEMEDLYSMVRNVTHFYRVLGKERIGLIKEILGSESAVVEPAMAVLYARMAVCGQAVEGRNAQSNLKHMYQYACFFLNTLGGRGYLLRRESKTRMLTNYYALLTLDMANDARLNAYGLDIRPYLDYLFYDINNQKGLLYRQRYLTRLTALRDKYQ